jgi:hypothetical protein
MTAGLIMAMLVVMRHRSNLKRMLEGTEPKVKSRSERQAEKAARAAQADGGTAGHAGVNGGGVGEAGVSAERPDGAMAGR